MIQFIALERILLEKIGPIVGGGGIVVYINDRIPTKLRDDLNNPAYECLWVTIRPNWLARSISKIALCCVYLSPSLKSDEIDKLYNFI